MNLKNILKHSKYIKKYENNDMMPRDKLSFEEELEKNLILKDKYNRYLISTKKLRLKNIDALRQRFKEIDKELDTELQLDEALIIIKTSNIPLL
jgi:hypothetical protein